MADTTDGFYNDYAIDGWDEEEWDVDSGVEDTGPTDSERALEIFTELEDNPSIMREFNLLLRQRKIEQIKKK